MGAPDRVPASGAVLVEVEDIAVQGFPVPGGPVGAELARVVVDDVRDDLQPGVVVEVDIPGVGVLRNGVVDEVDVLSGAEPD